jgi:hypothetical protein
MRRAGYRLIKLTKLGHNKDVAAAGSERCELELSSENLRDVYMMSAISPVRP